MPSTPENGARIVLRSIVGADLADARVALARVGDGAIEFGARDDVLVEQPLHALEADPRELALRLGRRQLRPLLARVEQREHVAFADRAARTEGRSARPCPADRR